MINRKVKYFIEELDASIKWFNKHINKHYDNYELEVIDRYVQSSNGLKKMNQYIVFKAIIIYDTGKKRKDYALNIHKLYDELPSNLNVKKIEFDKEKLIEDIKNYNKGKFNVETASIDILTKSPTLVLYDKNGSLYNFEHDYLKIIFE